MKVFVFVPSISILRNFLQAFSFPFFIWLNQPFSLFFLIFTKQFYFFTEFFFIF